MIDTPATIRRGWRNLMLCGLVLGASAAVVAAQEQITQADLLRRVIDLQRLTTPPPVGERTGMFSSYDRRSQIDSAGKLVEWAADNDCGQFLRRGR